MPKPAIDLFAPCLQLEGGQTVQGTPWELAGEIQEHADLSGIACRDDGYGLIVTDVEMPGMNGHEFTAEIKRRPELHAIPVIMVSSVASEESRKRGAEAGISAYIVKGEFDQGAFLRVVREWVG